MRVQCNHDSSHRDSSLAATINKHLTTAMCLHSTFYERAMRVPKTSLLCTRSTCRTKSTHAYDPTLCS